jgi:hypothetical protein
MNSRLFHTGLFIVDCLLISFAVTLGMDGLTRAAPAYEMASRKADAPAFKLLEQYVREEKEDNG